MSRSSKAGLVVLALLSVADLLAPVLTDGEFPPMPVALAVSALGLVSLVLVGLAWRGSRRAVAALVAVRLLSALAAAPALVMAGTVPVAVTVVVSAGIGLTVVGVVLLLVGSVTGRQPVAAGAR